MNRKDGILTDKFVKTNNTRLLAAHDKLRKRSKEKFARQARNTVLFQP